MRTLFLRIFLWFWLAMAAVAGLLIVTSPLLSRGRPSLDRWEKDAGRMAEERARRIASFLGKEGIRPSERPGEEENPGRPDRFYVVDLEGRELRGAVLPAEAQALARRASANGQLSTQREGALHLAAVPARLADGRAVVVVQTLRRPPGLRDLLDPGWLVPRLLVLTALAGLLCFWLARQLSSPVVAVREATRRLAGGDLAARVGASVGTRRDDIADLARDIDAMAERVVELLGSQQRLLRDVSHELRSPLARLGVALELARTGPEEKRNRALDRIGEEADRLAAMIEQLLTLSRLEAGVPGLERVWVDVRALTAAVVDDAAFEASARRCSVRLVAGEPCEVEGSPALLRSALENVVRNAVRHTDEGTGIGVWVGVEGTPGCRRASIRVRDHGPGVPGELLQEIFKPFVRVDGARERGRGGAGLGLAIAVRAIEAHGGSIEAGNAPGGGLDVTIVLPAQ
jgi:two-component system sensor histidine kinase CpxA